MRRTRRKAAQLGRSLEVLARMHGGIDLGPDSVVQEICRGLGLTDDGHVLRCFAFGLRHVTLLAPTPRTWHGGSCRRRLEMVREAARERGRFVEILPPDRIGRQPRLDNAVRIVAAAIPPFAGDADLLDRLIAEAGGAVDLGQCLEALQGRHATGRIYGLVTGGRFEILHDRTLGPGSEIRRRATDAFLEEAIPRSPSAGAMPSAP